MSKVKVINREVTEKETEFDYPIYLYFQDEDCHDEYVKVDEKYYIKIKDTHFNSTIEVGQKYNIEWWYLTEQTTKELFDEKLKETIKFINDKVQ